MIHLVFRSMLFLIAGTVLLLCGCGSTNTEQVKIRFAPLRPLTFGVFPFRETNALRAALDPLTRWLSRRLETPVQLRLVQDYSELERLVNDKPVGDA